MFYCQSSVSWADTRCLLLPAPIRHNAEDAPTIGNILYFQGKWLTWCMLHTKCRSLVDTKLWSRTGSSNSSRRDQCLNVDGLKGEYREMIHKCIHTFPIFSFRICRAALHWCLAMLSYLYDTHTHNLLNKLVLSRRIGVFTLWCACLIIEQHLCWNQCYWLNIKRKNINTVELRAASHDSPYVWKMHEV